MKKQTTFKLEDTSSFLTLTKDYFKGAGFTLTSESVNQVSFTKGNTLHNMIAFNPLNWKSRIDISLKDGIVVAVFDINTVGQMVSPNEEKLWDAFVENYKVSLVNNPDVAAENKQLVTEIKKDNWQFAKAALLGGLVFGVPSGFIGHYTGINTLASMGAALGAVLFVKYKMDKQKARMGR